MFSFGQGFADKGELEEIQKRHNPAAMSRLSKGWQYRGWSTCQHLSPGCFTKTRSFFIFQKTENTFVSIEAPITLGLWADHGSSGTLAPSWRSQVREKMPRPLHGDAMTEESIAEECLGVLEFRVPWGGR